MIGRLSGTLLEKNPPQVCLDVNGVGYDIDVPMSTFYQLPDVGRACTLHTHLLVREDAHILFGFASPAERATFRQLIRISGIGARMALAVLSGLSAADLAQAVTQQDTSRLVRIPGIGKKTAERLLLELKGKLGADLGTPVAPEGAARADILHALAALGYSEKEAAAAVRALPTDVSVSDGIKQALKTLAR